MWGSRFSQSSSLTVNGFLLLRNLAKTHLVGNELQFKVNSSGILLGISGSPGVSSSPRFFLGLVFSMYSFIQFTPQHKNVKYSLHSDFSLRLLVIKSGNGLATSSWFTDSVFLLSSYCLPGLVLGAGGKDIYLSAVTELIF